jgi:hypothetical protein
MDSEQPLHLIEQLVPLLREKDFDEIFNRLTQNENTNSRFLLKMELKRKCTPAGASSTCATSWAPSVRCMSSTG